LVTCEKDTPKLPGGGEEFRSLLSAAATLRPRLRPAYQQGSPRTLPAISWSEGCVYTVVVSVEAGAAKGRGEKRPRDARYTLLRAVRRREW
jgi:hypothetical protein